MQNCAQNHMFYNAAANCAASFCSCASETNCFGVVLGVAVLAASIFVYLLVCKGAMILTGLLLMILLRKQSRQADAYAVHRNTNLVAAAA